MAPPPPRRSGAGTTPSAILSYENEDAALIPYLERRGYRTVPVFHVNGSRVPPPLAALARPSQTLLSYLRDALRLTGTKLGCAEGGCGACTVLLSRYDGESGRVVHGSVNACLMPVLAADGCHVTTVEGVGSVRGDGLHPIQRAMVDMGGSQCGYCTPGIIVALYGLLAYDPAAEHVEEHLDGNLCRCTGYRPIWDAARSLCADSADGGAADSDAGGTGGPRGEPCGTRPEAETCELDCDVGGRISRLEEEEEKKTESGFGGGVCVSSSSSDKAKEFRDALAGGSTSWLDRPDDMFPEELMSTESGTAGSEASRPLVVMDDTRPAGGTWFKAHTLEEMLGLMRRFGKECKIVVGNTEVGIETKFKRAVYPRLIYPSPSIPTLHAVTATATHLIIGACAPLSTIQHKCESLLEDGSSPPGLRRIASPIRDMLRWFASTQIRNVACLGGNLVTGSPISDMNPLLASTGAELILASLSPGGGEGIVRRRVPVSEFFLSYRKVDLRPHEVMESVEVPFTRRALEYVVPFKQARRREDDISIVTAGMRVVLNPNESNDGYTISDAGLAFGGVAPKTVMATGTMKFLVGKSLCEGTFREAGNELMAELNIPPDAPGGQVEYRRALASSFLLKFYLAVVEFLEPDITAVSSDPGAFVGLGLAPPLPAAPTVPEEERSGAASFLGRRKPRFGGKQRYPAPRVGRGLEAVRTDGTVPGGAADTIDKIAGEATEAAAGAGGATKAGAGGGAKSVSDSVGRPATHASAPLHCTGEALYADDVPPPPGTLHGALVLATRCHARVKSIDASKALAVHGVEAVVTHRDLVELGGDNRLGPIVMDEFVFLPVGESVAFVGQVLGICVAETLEDAELGARTVRVEYEDMDGEPVVTIEQAIAAGSFYESARHKLERGDVETALAQTSLDGDGGGGRVVTVSGSFRCGGQEHFYLETNSTLVVPSESGGDVVIYCSTQAPTKTQMFCASATGTQASRVVVRMKRMGGGFGGKETRSVFASCAAAVAAKATNRPVRLTLGRDVDMSITGGRHTFLANYRAAAIVKEDGSAQLHALDVRLYSNGGSALDLSGPVMDRALFHVDGCYNFPHFRAEGVPCRTSQPPHTAFRGFGGPQGMAVCESVVDHLAAECGVPGDDLRRGSMYRPGETAPFGMVIGGAQCNGRWHVPDMWDRLCKELDIPSRRASIEVFNSRNRWVKRGLACVPVKFGIAFTAKFMNQGGALVHLYTDGTVLVTHGGTEMGQGLHTKVCQIAAQAFGIPLEDVYINDTSTDKIANTMPTAASASTDMYGMATLDACRQILKRLEPVREKLGEDASLKDVAKAAHMEMIDLSAHGFFALDDGRCGYDWDMPRPGDYPPEAPENAWRGHPFNYFTQGVAATTVEIDVLTGNHRTLSSDIIIDVGSSVNPSIDIGQAEGAFIQGMGWSTIEEVVYADDEHAWIRPAGKVFTSGPGTYKIPAFNDVPESFNVTLLEDADNPFAVHSSKAIGEPPFFLGCSVFFAIKEAVRAARAERFGDAHFEMRMPATSERIRMYCADEIAVDSVGLGEADGNKTQRMANYQPKGSN